MKPYLYLMLLLVFAYSCQKDLPADNNRTLRTTLRSDSTNQGDSTAPPPFPLKNLNSQQPASCPVLSLYGDTLVFPQPTATDDVITPVNGVGPGKYFSWPAGMVINQTTGAINLTQSQSGMRYAVGFVPAGTTDTCISTLIIAGAAYYDSLYVIGDTNSFVAMPYFNADAGLNVCTTPGACTFDYDGQAAKKGVFVDSSTGEIQITAITNGKGQLKGLFSGAIKNGATAVVNINYMINDGSHDAPQHINVKFEYYDTPAQIPPGQLNIMQSQTFNAMNDMLLSTSRNPRPPVIIIVRRNN